MRQKCGMTVKVVFEPSTGNCDCRKTSCLKTAKQCDKIYKQVKIAALVDALKELGVDPKQEKKNTDALDICNLIRKKLMEVSKGQTETFGFVAMFMDIVNAAQGQVIGIAEEQQIPTKPKDERSCENCGNKMLCSKRGVLCPSWYLEICGEPKAQEPIENSPEWCKLNNCNPIYTTQEQAGDDYPAEIIARVTRAVRECDEGFEKTGGSSRHWVRDWFLPKMEEHGLSIVDLSYAKERDDLRARLERAEKSLRMIGSVDLGGELWMPPLGKAPDFDEIDKLRARLALLEKENEELKRQLKSEVK